MDTQRWVVVGGKAQGGVMVRQGKALSSKEEAERLSTGALVQQLGKVQGDRLNFQRLVGTGPATGWVSIKLKDKELMAQVDGHERFEVIFKPRAVARTEPRPDALMVATLDTGTQFEAERWSEDGKWIQIRNAEDAENVSQVKWIMFEHAEHGQLVKLLPPSTKSYTADVGSGGSGGSLAKKSWNVEFKFKGCGANVKALEGGIDGASREELFDFLIRQHIDPALRVDFRPSIPKQVYDTAVANEADCVAFFQTAGHIVPDELEPGKRGKLSPSGVRQYLQTYGDLRCVVLQSDKDAEIGAIVVLAHGWNVLGDDLFGFAYNLMRPGLRFILPEGPCELEVENPDDDPEIEWMRKPRQWFPPSSGQKGFNDIARVLATCAAEARAHATGAKLLLGGFSQGALVALGAATGLRDCPVSGLILLAAQLPPDTSELLKSSLAGTSVFVAAGSADEVAPVSACQKLLDACKDAGATTKPLFKHDGAHEVNMSVVKAVKGFLAECLR